MMDAAISHALPRAADALPVGTNLSGDQFTITSQVGAGGFGITYRAEDNVLGRTTVIKECFSEDYCYREGRNIVARSPDYDVQFKSIVTMFMREARSLAKLRHPNIVTVHRVFEENQTAYMVLDLIDGFDLFEILNRTLAPLPPDGVAEILLQLLDAIEKVHEMDLLHRDISPDNIILDKSGVPVLIDFGAARGDASKRTRAVSSLLVVKDGYSPNEFYVPGSRQSPSSDLYALGATFYHAISGVPPVNSQARMVEVAGHRPDPCKPLSGRFDTYDPAFLAAIDKAMQVHPADRIQSAAEWRDMIDGVTAGGKIPTQPMPAPVVAPEKIEISLTELVETTNDEVRKTRMIEVEPKEKPAPVSKSSVPEWVEEFNEDAADYSDDDDDAFDDPARDDTWVNGAEDDDFMPASSMRSRTRVVQAVPTKPLPETDWVSRALEKRERTRLMQLEAAVAADGGGRPTTRISELLKTPSAPVEASSPQQKPEPQTVSQMIGPLLKMLFAGITIGLVVVAGVLWVLPMLNLGI